MCGRTACTLGPNDLVRRCASTLPKTSSKGGVKWVDNPHDGHVYSTSYNKAPGSICPVLVAKRHLPKIQSPAFEAKDDNDDDDSREGERDEKNDVEENERRLMNGVKGGGRVDGRGKEENITDVRTGNDRKDDDDDEGDVCLFPMLWGLVPSWHEGHPQKTGLSTSNCRSEGMFEKKMFSECLQRHQRCVIVVDGFYEWKTQEVVKPGAAKKKTTTTTKQPYFIFDGTKTDLGAAKTEDSIPAATGTTATSDLSTVIETTATSDPSTETDSSNTPPPVGAPPPPRLLAIAGLFRQGSPRSGEGRDPHNPLYSYSVVTVPTAPTMQWLHHRQPAVLTSEEEILSWLGAGELTAERVKGLIRPVDSLAFYPVSSLVNNARVNDEKCMAPIDLVAEEEKKKPKPNALTHWLAKGASSTPPSDAARAEVGSKEDGVNKKKRHDDDAAAKVDLMSAWLAKGKRKSAASNENDDAMSKKTKTGN